MLLTYASKTFIGTFTSDKVMGQECHWIGELCTSQSQQKPTKPKQKGCWDINLYKQNKLGSRTPWQTKAPGKHWKYNSQKCSMLAAGSQFYSSKKTIERCFCKAWHQSARTSSVEIWREHPSREHASFVTKCSEQPNSDTAQLSTDPDTESSQNFEWKTHPKKKTSILELCWVRRI